jgi:hypothetical protein
LWFERILPEETMSPESTPLMAGGTILRKNLAGTFSGPGIFMINFFYPDFFAPGIFSNRRFLDLKKIPGKNSAIKIF